MVPNVFKLIISLATKTKTMVMVLNTREMLVLSTWKALQALNIKFLYSLAAKPNMVSRQAFSKMYYYFIYATSAVYVSKVVCNGILVYFTPFECHDVEHLHILQKIHKKCPCTITKITKKPLKLHSLPGWHIKNSVPIFFFCKMLVLIQGFVWRLEGKEIQ